MSQPQILIHEMSYHLTSGFPLFKLLTLTFSQRKIGLVGRNGVGKSTLLQLITGQLQPLSGSIHTDGKIAYIPQNPIINYDHNMTVAALFGLENKIHALERIEQGSIDLADYEILNEDWECKHRLNQQLQTFSLKNISYYKRLTACSGGELTRLLLTKAFNDDADFLLLDEPTNHLDTNARLALYAAIQQWQGGIIIASHDRALLNTMDEIIELTSLGATIYGGNYDAYMTQKNIENAALKQQLNDAKKLMADNKNSIQSSREKHEKKQSYGRQLRISGSIDKMAAGSKKGRSERTQSTLLIKEMRMMQEAQNKMQSAKEKIEIRELIDVELPKTYVPNGKIIMEIKHLSFTYQGIDHKLIDNFNLKIIGPEHIAISGPNGSGKSTLMKLILGILTPMHGQIVLGTPYLTYIDQHGSLLHQNESVIDNFLRLNPEATRNLAYCCLAKFLFKNTATEKRINELSGGQKMRALLVCTLMARHPPQLLMLDEPTNHLDIDSMRSIESALKAYQGAILVISHDQAFLNSIGITKTIFLSNVQE